MCPKGDLEETAKSLPYSKKLAHLQGTNLKGKNQKWPPATSVIIKYSYAGCCEATAPETQTQAEEELGSQEKDKK